MSKIRAGLIVALIGLTLAACSQAPRSDAAKAPEPTLETASISTTGPYTEGTWFKGSPNQTLIHANQGFCYLAGIQGNFDNGSEDANVFINGYTNVYTLNGKNAEWAKAICVNWSALKINYNAFEPVRWLSDEVYSVALPGKTDYSDLWYGDAVTFLTRVSGNFAAGGGAFVIQSSKGDKPSQLLATHNANSSSEIIAAARSMFFGRPHNNDMPQFWGPKAQGLTYSLAGYYYVQSNTQPSVEMAPTDKAFCYLQTINGNYNDASDWAWIHKGYNGAGKLVWKLSVHDGNPANGKFVGAGAACYMLSQN